MLISLFCISGLGIDNMPFSFLCLQMENYVLQTIIERLWIEATTITESGLE